jgi:hypothetical protein
MIDHEPGKRFYSATVLGVLLAVFAFFEAWSYAGSQPGIDFYQLSTNQAPPISTPTGPRARSATDSIARP